MPVIQPITSSSGSFPFVPNTRTLTINGVAYDLSADRSWTISTSGTGTVTSVALSATMPTGLVASISGSPITSNGTLGLTITMQSGYSIPTNTKQSNWDSAYAFTNAFPTGTAQQLLRYNTLGTALEFFTPNFIVSTDIIATTPLVWNSGTKTMSIPQANNTTNGFLSSADWLTFSSKQPAITLTTTGSSGASTFNNITGALNIPQYTLIGLGGFANPMTTAGDIMIARSTGEPERFAGNNTTTRKYFSQIGDGTSVISTSWETIAGTIGGSGTTNYVPVFTSSNAIGNSIITSTSSIISIGQGGTGIEYAIQIGTNRGGNGYAYIDLIGDETYTDFGLRVIRNNTGANTTSLIEHRGTGDFLLKTTDSAQFKVQTASTDKLAIYANGQLRLNAYTSTTSFSGVAIGLLAYDGFGQVITQPNLPQSGNYTPTLYAGTNISATTAYNCQYIRIGNVVSVSGRLEANGTTAGVTSSVDVELPYNTTFTSADQCNGVLTAQDNICGIIYGGSTRATLVFTPANTGSFNYFFTLHFQII